VSGIFFTIKHNKGKNSLACIFLSGRGVVLLVSVVLCFKYYFQCNQNLFGWMDGEQILPTKERVSQ
jgi:hypothetical protein